MAQLLRQHDAREAQILSTALVRAADYWGLSNRQVAMIIGVSEATISRLRHGQYIIPKDSKSWELAVIFLRIFRGLDAYMGGNTENEKRWLGAQNTVLGGVPIELMARIEGLSHVVRYIDYMRGQ